MFKPLANSRRQTRHATSMLEVIVALTLLICVLSVSVSLLFRHGRLLIAQRHYRQALDEVSNQLDRITALQLSDVASSLKKLAVSEFAAERLADAKLTGEATPTDIGQRVVLRLTWKEAQEQTVAMTGWILPSSRAGEQKAQ